MDTIRTAFTEYSRRPKDERLPSIQALIDQAIHDKDHSAERNYNLKDLQVVVANSHNTDGFDPTPDQATLQLQSPKGRAAFTHWSFGQLCRTVGAPAGYLREIPAAIAADCLNYGLQDANPGTAANLLIKANGSAPIVRACTSDSYGRVWDAELYGQIGRQLLSTDDRWSLPPTWSGEPAGAYRGDRDSFLIVTNGGSIVKDPSIRTDSSAGPNDGAMYRGLLVRNSEVGASSIVIEQILFRYICGNHMLWGAVYDQRFRRRHVGSKIVRDVVREISTIAFKWGSASVARDNALIQGLIDREIAHTKEAVIDELKAIGFTKDQATQAYATCEQTESVNPRSFWGIAQGATRLSQESGYQDDRYILDQLAAKIMARGAKLVAA